MKLKLLTLTLLTAFILAGTQVPVVASTQTMVTGAKILIYVGNNPAHYDAEGFLTNYTDAGNVVNVTDTYDFTQLSTDGFDALLIPGSGNFTATEITAIDTWFDTGNKLLWVAGDSDYGGYWNASLTNPILEGVGTVLRLDAGAIADSQSKDGASYRVVANETGVSSPLTDYVTEGFVSTIFHGPTAVLGYTGSKYVDLRNNTFANVDIVINSSAAAEALDQDTSVSPADFYAYSDITGNYPMMATELIGTSRVVVTGEATFMDYKNMYGNTFEKAGTHHDGSMIVDNMLAYFFGMENSFNLVEVVVRTVTATEIVTETETETVNNTVSTTVTVTEPTTVTNTFTESKTEGPISFAAPLIALMSVAAVAAIIRKKNY